MLGDDRPLLGAPGRAESSCAAADPGEVPVVDEADDRLGVGERGRDGARVARRLRRASVYIARAPIELDQVELLQLVENRAMVELGRRELRSRSWTSSQRP